MASSSLACLVSIGFLSRFLLRPVRPVAASISRSFSSRAVSQNDDDDRSDRSLEVDHDQTMCHHDDLFSDPFDLFYPTRSLGEVLNLMHLFTYNPFFSASRGVGDGFCLGWDARETVDALHLRVDMPGLDKEDVKVYVVQNTLTIEGESGKEEEDDEENVRRYSRRINLSEKIYKFYQINAEMKNGMLRVVVPKFKEETNDTFEVKIE